MSLLDMIYNIGGMLRVVRVDSPAAPKAPAKITTRTYTLAQLTSEIASRDVQALAELPAELSIPFADIFAAAGVAAAAHGWNVEKLRDLLAAAPYFDMSGDELTRAVVARLEEDGCGAEDLARDAIGRDQAMDAFEDFARDKMRVRSEARRRKIAELNEEIARVESEVRRLEEEAVADRRQWRDWHRQKTDYEKMMAAALSCLLDKPIVTLDPDEE